MPTCLFCKRDDLPRVPLTPIAAAVLVAHVDAHGEPCLEGAAPEAHAQMLGDYPHFELLDDDGEWDLDDAPAVAPPPAELSPEVTVSEALTAPDPIVEPSPALAQPRKRRRRRDAENP